MCPTKERLAIQISEELRSLHSMVSITCVEIKIPRNSKVVISRNLQFQCLRVKVSVKQEIHILEVYCTSWLL